MKEKTRLTLEYAIKQLDNATHPPNSWKVQAEEVARSGDEEALRKFYIAITLLREIEQGVDDAVGRMLVGENILTPSLTNKGWQFWKQPLLTEKQRKEVESAIVRWSKTKVAQLKSLVDTQEKSPNKDDSSSGIIFLASAMDMASYCRQQLSSDLKAILDRAEGD